MIGRNNLFKAERIEQLTLVPIELTHHGIAPSRIAIPRRNHCSQAPSTTFATKSALNGRDYASQTDDIRNRGKGSLRQAGLCLSQRRGCASLSGWRKAEVPLYERGERAEAATLLDKCVSPLCAQATLHHRRATAHRALGA